MLIIEENICQQIRKYILQDDKDRYLFKIDTLSLPHLYNVARMLLENVEGFDLAIGFTKGDNLPLDIAQKVVKGGITLTKYRNGFGMRKNLIVLVDGDTEVANSLGEPPFIKLSFIVDSIEGVFKQWYGEDLPEVVMSLANAIEELPEIQIEQVIAYLEAVGEPNLNSYKWATALPLLGIFKDENGFRHKLGVGNIAKRLKKNYNQAAKIECLLEKATYETSKQKKWWREFYIHYHNGKENVLANYELEDILMIKNGKPPTEEEFDDHPAGDSFIDLLNQYGISSKIRNKLKAITPFIGGQLNTLQAFDNLLRHIATSENKEQDIGRYLPEVGLLSDNSDNCIRAFNKISTWKKYLEDNQRITKSLEVDSFTDHRGAENKYINEYIKTKDIKFLYNFTIEDICSNAGFDIDFSVRGNNFWTIICEIASRVRLSIPADGFTIYVQHNKKSIDITNTYAVQKWFAGIINKLSKKKGEDVHIVLTYAIHVKLEKLYSPLEFSVEQEYNYNFAKFLSKIWSNENYVVKAVVSDDKGWHGNTVWDADTVEEEDEETGCGFKVYTLDQMVESFEKLIVVFPLEFIKTIKQLFECFVQNYKNFLNELKMNGEIVYYAYAVGFNAGTAEKYIESYKELLDACKTFCSQPIVSPYLNKLIDDCFIHVLNIGTIMRDYEQIVITPMHPLHLRMLLSYERKAIELVRQMMKEPGSNVDMTALKNFRVNSPTVVTIESKKEINNGHQILFEKEYTVDGYSDIYSSLQNTRSTRKIKDVEREICEYAEIFPYSQDKMNVVVVNPGTGEAIYETLKSLILKYSQAKFSLTLCTINAQDDTDFAGFLAQKACLNEEDPVFDFLNGEEFSRTIFSVKRYPTTDDFIEDLMGNPRQHIILLKDYFEDKKQIGFAPVDSVPAVQLFPNDVLVDKSVRIDYYDTVNSWRMPLADKNDYYELLYQTVVIQAWKRTSLSDGLHNIYIELCMNSNKDFPLFYEQLHKHSSWVMVHDRMFGPEYFKNSMKVFEQNIIAFKSSHDEKITNRLIISSNERELVISNLFAVLERYGLTREIKDFSCFANELLDRFMNISNTMSLKAIENNKICEMLGALLGYMLVPNHDIYFILSEYEQFVPGMAIPEIKIKNRILIGVTLKMNELSQLIVDIGVIETLFTPINNSQNNNTGSILKLVDHINYWFSEESSQASNCLNREYSIGKFEDVLYERYLNCNKFDRNIGDMLGTMVNNTRHIQVSTYKVISNPSRQDDSNLVLDDGTQIITIGFNTIRQLLAAKEM